MKLSWSHCVLQARDVDALAAFYCDTFGLVISDRGGLGPDQEIVFLSGSSSDHHQIAFTTGRADDDTGGSLVHNAFRVDSIAEVQAMFNRVTADERVSGGLPSTHGNAISVYFADPEGNGVEVFCDTPWHVKQPQIRRWDPSQTPEEILAGVRGQFQNEPEFRPMAEYRTERAAAFGE